MWGQNFQEIQLFDFRGSIGAGSCNARTEFGSTHKHRFLPLTSFVSTQTSHSVAQNFHSTLTVLTRFFPLAPLVDRPSLRICSTAPWMASPRCVSSGRCRRCGPAAAPWCGSQSSVLQRWGDIWMQVGREWIWGGWEACFSFFWGVILFFGWLGEVDEVCLFLDVMCIFFVLGWFGRWGRIDHPNSGRSFLVCNSLLSWLIPFSQPVWLTNHLTRVSQQTETPEALMVWSAPWWTPELKLNSWRPPHAMRLLVNAPGVRPERCWRMDSHWKATGWGLVAHEAEENHHHQNRHQLSVSMQLSERLKYSVASSFTGPCRRLRRQDAGPPEAAGDAGDDRNAAGHGEFGGNPEIRGGTFSSEGGGEERWSWRTLGSSLICIRVSEDLCGNTTPRKHHSKIHQNPFHVDAAFPSPSTLNSFALQKKHSHLAVVRLALGHRSRWTVCSLAPSTSAAPWVRRARASKAPRRSEPWRGSRPWQSETGRSWVTWKKMDAGGVKGAGWLKLEEEPGFLRSSW